MKSRDTVVRLKRFQVEEKRRRVAQIEMMMADFGRIAAELDREIAHEEQKTGISDPHHFAYSTYARAASQRRDNLRRSARTSPRSSTRRRRISAKRSRTCARPRASRAASVRASARPKRCATG
jgi:hypothetical protein